MSQIESAARDIVIQFDLHRSHKEVDQIIRRHLFPVVTDPQDGKIYWVKAGNRFYLSNGEIPEVGTYYGPIPEPA
jgi:hypothetical protein